LILQNQSFFVFLCTQKGLPHGVDHSLGSTASAHFLLLTHFHGLCQAICTWLITRTGAVTYKQQKSEKEKMDKAPSLLRIGASFLLIDVLPIGNCT
jgi:hypothetical protein